MKWRSIKESCSCEIVDCGRGIRSLLIRHGDIDGCATIFQLLLSLSVNDSDVLAHTIIATRGMVKDVGNIGKETTIL